MSLLGLDLGADTTTLVSLRRRGTMVWLTGGVVATTSDAGESSTDADGVMALRRELQAAGVKPGQVALGLPGLDSSLRYLHMPPVPRWRLELIMQYELEEVQGQLNEPLVADHRILGGTGDIDGGRTELCVLVVMAKDKAIDPRIAALERIGLVTRAVLPRSIALFNAFRGLGLHQPGQCDLLLDIGRDGMDLAIQRDGFLLFARSLSEGAEAFTERIAQELNLPRTDAELRKRRAEEEPKGSPVRRTLEGAYGKLAGTLRSTLLFARSQTRIADLNVDRIWLSGGGARSFGLRERLEAALQTPVQYFDVFDHVETDALPPEERAYLKARSLELTISCGLALIGDHPAAVQLDLLPERVQKRLTFRRQTLPLMVAAALLCIYLLVSGVGALNRQAEATDINEQLTGLTASLDQRQQAMMAVRQGNGQLQARYRELARRTDGGPYLVRLTELLHESVPSQRISLEGVQLGPPEGFQQSGQVGIWNEQGQVLLGLTGEVDDSLNQGTNTVRQLVEAIEADPAFESADYRSLPRRDGRLDFYPFEIRVVAKGE